MVSSNEISVGPLADATDDPIRGADQLSHHDSDGESLTETEPEAQHILKEIRTKR